MRERLLVRVGIDERLAAARFHAEAGEHERARRLGSEAVALAAVAALPAPSDLPAADR